MFIKSMVWYHFPIICIHCVLSIRRSSVKFGKKQEGCVLLSTVAMSEFVETGRHEDTISSKPQRYKKNVVKKRQVDIIEKKRTFAK